MAPTVWSDLPTADILPLIAKILNTDVDTLRLRSVCSSWRSFVRPRLRPSPFPMKLPPFKSNSSQDYYFSLSYTTLYHISPSNYGPHTGDPSDGWLVRASEVNPSRFSLFTPLFPNVVKFPPETIPEHLNLLDYRISEVCKCYNLTFVHANRSAVDAWPIVKKTIVLRNYAVGCEFAVLTLLLDWRMSYCKSGDKEWTPIDTKVYDVTDVIVSKGKLYAISRQGVLVSFDSNFNLTVVQFPKLPATCVENNSCLVDYKSDLYVCTKILKHASDSDVDVEKDPNEIPLRLEILKKGGDNWQNITCLGNDLFFSSDDFSVGFSVEDFKGFKGNCVYMVHTDADYSLHSGQDFLVGVYNLDVGRTTSLMKTDQDQALLHWPSPAWINAHV